ERLRREGVAAARIRVIPNGVDADQFSVPRMARPIETVLTVANLRHEKAHQVLITAAAQLAPRHPALRFQIAGDGPRAAELRALAGAAGIESRFSFLGHREDVPALLAQADAFVLPSRSEAFPNSVVEAMAAGLPVVACAVGGLLDLVEPGRTGLLVPPDDPAALASALESLIASPERAMSLGAEARGEIAGRYS